MEGLTPLLAKLDGGVVTADKPRGCFKLLKRDSKGPRFAAGDVVKVEGLMAVWIPFDGASSARVE